MSVEFRRVARQEWAFGRRGKLMMKTRGHVAQVEQHLSMGLGPIQVVFVVPGPAIDATARAASLTSASNAQPAA